MNNDKNAFGWLLGHAGSRKKNFSISVLFAALSTLCGILPYYFVTRIIKNLISGNRELKEYAFLCGIILLLWFGKSLFHALSTAESHLATFHVLAEIRKKTLDKLARMPLGDVTSRASGSLKNTIVERIDSIETTLAHILPEFTTGLSAPVIILIYIFTINFKMGLISLITIPVGIVCYMFMMLGYEENYNKTVKATKALNDASVEYINGIEVIKVFGKSESSYKKFADSAKASAKSFVDWMKKSNIFMTFALCIMPATMITVLPLGGIMAMHGNITAVDFISVIIMNIGLIEPLLNIMGYMDDIAQMSTIVGEIRDILDSREMKRPESDGRKMTGFDIELSDVHFGYNEKEILHGVNIKAHQGEYIALVGPSGSGKSTIAKLIAGLWDVDSGSIKIGGTDIKNFSFDEYNKHIAYVSQENYLFNMTIMENISLGKTDGKATKEEVIAVAKKSGCHDFIMNLENGYNTVVGSAGGHLSGGEKQRICIARAMLQNADIIILDEATAYMDAESQFLIQESVAKLVEGKTMIVIAHRLSTITNADCIYVVKNGLIAESGKHDELIKRNDIYSKMWTSHLYAKDGE